MSVANVVDSSRRWRRLPRAIGWASGWARALRGRRSPRSTRGPAAACVIKLFAEGSRGRRFALAEFRGLETLNHPSVVRLRDIGRLDDGRLYLVTDRIVGPGIEGIATIADEGERRSLFARAALDLASALAHLHARGIVHGDVCPANVRMAAVDGAAPRAVLIDFGLAGPPRPGDGAARGTLGYAAPEALTGARTPAADLFALGATLFEAWSGTPPFGRGLAAAERMLAGPAPPLSSVRRGARRRLGRAPRAAPRRRCGRAAGQRAPRAARGDAPGGGRRDADGDRSSGPVSRTAIRWPGSSSAAASSERRCGRCSSASRRGRRPSRRWRSSGRRGPAAARCSSRWRATRRSQRRRGPWRRSRSGAATSRRWSGWSAQFAAGARRRRAPRGRGAYGGAGGGDRGARRAPARSACCSTRGPPP